MKKVLVFFVMLMVCSVTFGQTKRVYAKMVIDDTEKALGRYLGTHAQNIRVGVNDSTEIEVPKTGHKIVTYTAYNGQGYVYVPKSTVRFRSRADKTSPVVLEQSGGESKPTCYPCVSLENGWFKVKIDGKPAFVREEEVEWTPLCL